MLISFLFFALAAKAQSQTPTKAPTSRSDMQICFQDTYNKIADKNLELLKTRDFNTAFTNNTCGNPIKPRADGSFTYSTKNLPFEVRNNPPDINGSFESQWSDADEFQNKPCIYAFKDKDGRSFNSMVNSPGRIRSDLGTGTSRDESINTMLVYLLQHAANRSPKDRLAILQKDAIVSTDGQDPVTNFQCPAESLVLAHLYDAAADCMHSLPAYKEIDWKDPQKLADFKCDNFQTSVMQQSKLDGQDEGDKVHADESCSWNEMKQDMSSNQETYSRYYGQIQSPCDKNAIIEVCSGLMTCEVKNEAGRKVKVTLPASCSGKACSRDNTTGVAATMCARDDSVKTPTGSRGIGIRNSTRFNEGARQAK